MNDNEVRRENQPQTGIVFLMSVLHAWLEYTDDQGFARRLKLEEDVNYLKKALVGAALEQEGSSYLIAQTAPNVSVLVNGRSVRKARLNNLDLVQVGTRRFIFHATYLPNTPPPPNPPRRPGAPHPPPATPPPRPRAPCASIPLQGNPPPSSPGAWCCCPGASGRKP